MALSIDSPPATLDTGATADAFERAVYRKVALRILPLLVFGYILNYLDRINIGIAQIQFKSDLGLAMRPTVSAPVCCSSAMWCSRFRAI